MLLAETEYRHQVEAVIRPFRELLLGLFFISVGMLLDLHLIQQQFWLISATVVGLVALKVLGATLAVRSFVNSNFKALRTALLQGGGGEFGIALLTLLIKAPNSVAPNSVIQPLLLALVITMLVRRSASATTSPSRASCCARRGRRNARSSARMRPPAMWQNAST